MCRKHKKYYLFFPVVPTDDALRTASTVLSGVTNNTYLFIFIQINKLVNYIIVTTGRRTDGWTDTTAGLGV